MGQFKPALFNTPYAPDTLPYSIIFDTLSVLNSCYSTQRAMPGHWKWLNKGKHVIYRSEPVYKTIDSVCKHNGVETWYICGGKPVPMGYFQCVDTQDFYEPPSEKLHFNFYVFYDRRLLFSTMHDEKPLFYQFVMPEIDTNYLLQLIKNGKR